MAAVLKTSYCEDDVVEIGVDEAGRGPMFGRVYTGAVVLPKSMAAFNHALMKDSKKFHSEKKIREVAEYIKANATAWAVGYADAAVIDSINIRNATHQAMREAIKTILDKQAQAEQAQAEQAQAEQAQAEQAQAEQAQAEQAQTLLLVDGNDFPKFIYNGKPMSHVCIEGGDNTYSSIAAASILAKVARDDYIADLCKEEPALIERYDLLKNKGYGTKKHMDGIRKYGITQWHRKSFGICKTFT